MFRVKVVLCKRGHMKFMGSCSVTVTLTLSLTLCANPNANPRRYNMAPRKFILAKSVMTGCDNYQKVPKTTHFGYGFWLRLTLRVVLSTENRNRHFKILTENCSVVFGNCHYCVND